MSVLDHEIHWLKMSRKPLAYKNLLLYNDSQISQADFLVFLNFRELLSKQRVTVASQLNNVPVRVYAIRPQSTLRCLHKHPIYNYFGSL